MSKEKKEISSVKFSHHRGVYPKVFALKLSAADKGKIRYTLDGKTPSKTTGALYKKSISLKSNTVVRACAYDKDGNESEIKTHSYFFADSLAYETGWEYKENISSEDYSESLLSAPIISASLDLDTSDDYQACSFEYIDSNIDQSNKNFHSNAGVKRFGEYSSRQFNSGVKFKFNDDYGVSKAKYEFFDAVADDVYKPINVIERLELKEGEDGPQKRSFALGTGFMRYSEKITMNLQKRMGKFALCTKFVHLYINGKYRGLKTMREDYAAQNEVFYFGDEGKNYTRINLQDKYFASGHVDEGDGDPKVWEAVQKLAASKDFQGFKEKVDVVDLIQFMLMFLFIDTENEATALIHNDAPKFMKMKFIINDTDGAFFDAPVFLGGGGNYKTKWSKTVCTNGPGGFFSSFAGTNTKADPGNLEFRTLVKDQVLKQIGPSVIPFEGVNDEPLSLKSVQSIMQDTVHELDVLYKMDAAFMGFNSNAYNRWKNLKQPIIFLQTVERVAFSLLKWKEQQLTHTLSEVEISKSANSEGSLIIEISNIDKGAKVYYTTNGSDPMGNDGVIASGALVYDGIKGIVVSSGVNSIVARSFVKDNWGPKAVESINILK